MLLRSPQFIPLLLVSGWLHDVGDDAAGIEGLAFAGPVQPVLLGVCLGAGQGFGHDLTSEVTSRLDRHLDDLERLHGFLLWVAVNGRGQYSKGSRLARASLERLRRRSLWTCLRSWKTPRGLRSLFLGTLMVAMIAMTRPLSLR